MKKTVALLLLCLLLGMNILPAAAAPSRLNLPPLETNEATFTAACKAAKWTPPTDYALEGFARAEFNNDSQTDMVVSMLKKGGRQRILVVFLSHGKEHQVLVNPYALPDTDAGGVWGDPLAGIQANEEGITLYIYGGSDDHYACVYSFSLVGNTFTLSTLTVLRWHTFLTDATWDVFNYAMGTYTRNRATIEAEEYTTLEQTASRTFDAQRYGPTLAAFQYATFPTDWASFEQWMHAPMPTAQPSATARRTHRPSPTATPSPTQAALVQCPTCGQWMTQYEYARHVCMPAPVQCPYCGQWMTPAEYARHNCLPQLVRCDVCGGWYEEGNVFRNHICMPGGF